MSESMTANQLPTTAECADTTSKSPTPTGKVASELGSASTEASPAARITLRSLRAEAEIRAISRALEQTGWNRKRAAELLSISYRGLLEKIRQHKITSQTSSQLTTLAHGAKVE
jgi:two-component system, NtrC family, response regulator AtoC